MKMAKPVLIAVIALLVYFVVFYDRMPKELVYRGNTLGPRQSVENNSNRDFEIVTYKDRSNYHQLVFLIPEDDSVTTQDLLDFYSANFKAQGFAFKNDGARRLGLKGDEVIYFTIARKMNAAIAYIEKGPAPLPESPGDATDVFASLAGFTL